MEHIDRLREAAEARLDRVDDEAVETAAEPGTREGVLDGGEYGIHVDDGGLPRGTPETTGAADGLWDDGQADLLDAAAEAFNARDLDGLLELVAADGEVPGLLGYERENLPEALEDLWIRRPGCCLTRGLVDDHYVGVLWDSDETVWWAIALVHVDDVDDGRAGVVELSDDPALLERVVADPPDPTDLDEGTRWSEWDEGADGP